MFKQFSGHRSGAGDHQNGILASVVIFLFEFLRCFLFDGFELPVEVRHIIIAAHETYFCNAEVFFNQHFTGMTNSDFIQEKGKVLTGPVPEIPAESRGAHIDNTGYFMQVNGVGEIAHDVFKDLVEPFRIFDVNTRSALVGQDFIITGIGNGIQYSE